jgi:pimeloyl-ACP methyl ester carboxylesterase
LKARPYTPAVHEVRAADGTGIAYETVEAGPALVFLHGITEDHRLRAPIVDGWSPDYACVLMDARGHGESDTARTGYDPFSTTI